MHELSLAESTLELALRHARQAGAARVTRLHLVVGEFTPLEQSSLDFYWDRITRGTSAAGSRVSIQRVPARMACVDCGGSIDPATEAWSCPACGSGRLRLTSGDECFLESIDVEGEAHEPSG